MSTTVEQMLKDKDGSSIVSIEPEATIHEASESLIKNNLGALLVMEEGKLIGIVTERDIARRLGTSGKSAKDFKVREFMTERITFVEPTHTLEECMGLMTKHRTRHLPVLENRRKVVGIISIGDAVKTMISDKQFMIDQLESYIYGQKSR